MASRGRPAPVMSAPGCKSSPTRSPCTMRPAGSTASSLPKVTARRHTCKSPAVAPAGPPRRRGTRPRVGSATAPCAPCESRGPPPVNGAGRRSAPGPQRAGSASRALLVLAWAFLRSPHPLDISADQSTWRSARRRTPGDPERTMRAPARPRPHVPAQHIPLLAEDAASRRGYGDGGGAGGGGQ